MPQDVIGVPNEEQALAAVGGGTDPDIPDSQKEYIANQITDAARANAQWRSSLSLDQQLALMNTPTISHPPAAESDNSEATTHAGV